MDAIFEVVILVLMAVTNQIVAAYRFLRRAGVSARNLKTVVKKVIG